MNRALRTIYATVLLAAMIAGEFVAILSTREKEIAATVFVVCGLVFALIFSPTAHELGHIVFGKMQNMRLKYAKFSFFRFVERNGKLSFSFASPLSPDETQMIPLSGGNMKRRAVLYGAGGLAFGGAYALITLLCALVLFFLKNTAAFFFWGGLPFAAYLFLLNLPPLSYADGKTDALILRGIKRGAAEEKAFVFAMEIFGALSEGKSFSEIDETYFRDLPVLPEDAPMYAIITDLNYRLELEKGNFNGAADKINRLAQCGYLTAVQTETTAAEITFMHALNRDAERMEQSKALCENYLKTDAASAHRILTAYHLAKGEIEKAEKERALAEAAAEKEPLKGEAKFEKILLSRL